MKLPLLAVWNIRGSTSTPLPSLLPAVRSSLRTEVGESRWWGEDLMGEWWALDLPIPGDSVCRADWCLSGFLASRVFVLFCFSGLKKKEWEIVDNQLFFFKFRRRSVYFQSIYIVYTMAETSPRNWSLAFSLYIWRSLWVFKIRSRTKPFKIQLV